jgi:hypothetical protein
LGALFARKRQVPTNPTDTFSRWSAVLLYAIELRRLLRDDDEPR